VVVAVVVVIADRVALHWTESRVSSRIETLYPGSHATVSISSSPYLVRLAAFGTVQEIHAHVTGLTDGGMHLDAVDITAHKLNVNRSDLVRGRVRLHSLGTATITATVSVAEVLRSHGYSALAGLSGLASGVQATIHTTGNQVQIAFGPVTFGVTETGLVPCVGSAKIERGEIILSCTTTTVPAALQAA
jgi:LmeA-like phospholipid-binding